MSPLAQDATTRRTRSLHGTSERPPLLETGERIVSPESGLHYDIDRKIGAGGYGEVYLATRRNRSATVPRQVCIKVSAHIDGWLREAYFGQRLQGHPRAIQVFDPFPLVRADGRVLYGLALEYACYGDLSAFLHASGRAWAESTTRREIAGLLEVLGHLHRGQLLHRDLTPVNVFVCERRRLKLGDFGIARHQKDRRGITVRALNPLMAPSDIVAGAAPKWQARDDVYQVGQLIGMLIKGDATARVHTGEVRGLECSDHLKEIIHRCIGERRKRYDSADALISALRNPPRALRAGALRSLKGAHVAFTGILGRPRKEAAIAARRAGAVVHGGPSARMTVLVRGRPNPTQAAGRDGSLKLMEIKRLRERGHRITLLNEVQFWKLAGKR